MTSDRIETHSFVGHEHCKSLHRYGPSIRAYYLLHFIIRGKGTFMTEKGDFELGKGEGFLISPGEVTTYVADEKDPWEYLWVGIAATKEIEEALKRHGLDRTTHRFSYRDNKGFLPYLVSIVGNGDKIDEPDWSTGAFYGLVNMIPVPKSTQRQFNIYIDRCYRFMETHFFETLTVDLLARHLNVSRSYLYRLFQSVLGISPRRAILNFRLDKAAELVERGGISLTEIAFSCGFCDLSHFSKAYKARFGRRPKSAKNDKE